MAVPVLTDEDIEFIQGNLNGIEERLKEKDIIKNLTPDDTQGLNIIGNKRKSAAQKALDIAKLKPGILAGDFSLDDYDARLNLIFAMEGKIQFLILSLNEMVKESRFFISDKAWDQAGQIKVALENANRTDPGLDVLVQELKEHFDRAPADGEPDEEEPPAPE